MNEQVKVAGESRPAGMLRPLSHPRHGGECTAPFDDAFFLDYGESAIAEARQEALVSGFINEGAKIMDKCRELQAFHNLANQTIASQNADIDRLTSINEALRLDDIQRRSDIASLTASLAKVTEQRDRLLAGCKEAMMAASDRRFILDRIITDCEQGGDNG